MAQKRAQGKKSSKKGRVGLDNLFSEEGPVGGGGEIPGKAFTWQAGGDWPEGGGGGREAK